MDNEMKRRAFLAGIISVVMGVPIGVRLLSGKRVGQREGHLFSKELKKCRSLVDITPATLDIQQAVMPNCVVPDEGTWRYVIFLPSFFPAEFSLATGNDPDAFFVRDGMVSFGRTDKGQHFIYGGDSRADLYTPTVHENRPLHEVSLLVRDHRIAPARMKGVTASHQRDWHFFNLLTLKDFPHKELKPGLKWKSGQGRIKPYGAYTTHCEVAGFSEVGNHKTVDIAFSGKLPNLVGMPGLNVQKLSPGSSITNEHRGHAWFDLETGLLVRQEVEMETLCSTSLPQRRRGNGRRQGEENTFSALIKSNHVMQLFTT